MYSTDRALPHIISALSIGITISKKAKFDNKHVAKLKGSLKVVSKS
jgi:hypothetical protein